MSATLFQPCEDHSYQSGATRVLFERFHGQFSRMKRGW